MTVKELRLKKILKIDDYIKLSKGHSIFRGTVIFIKNDGFFLWKGKKLFNNSLFISYEKFSDYKVEWL